MKGKLPHDTDPVCGDPVTHSNHVYEHLGVRFVFCSIDCLERFQLHPGLYVGCPGEKAPRQAGQEVIKNRRLKLAFPLMERKAEQVERCLRKLKGVKAVKACDDCVEVSYDLLLISAEEIEEYIISCGEDLGHRLRDRLERVFVHVEEQTEISSLEVHFKKKAD